MKAPVSESLLRLLPNQDILLPRTEFAALEPIDECLFFTLSVPDERWYFVHSFTEDEVRVYRLFIHDEGMDYLIMWLLAHCPMDEVMKLPRAALPLWEPMEETPYASFTTLDGRKHSYRVEDYSAHWTTIRRIEPARLPEIGSIT